MPGLPIPPGGRDVTWRPATPADAAALAALSTAVDAAEDLEDPIGPEGARYFLTFPGVDLTTDTLSAVAGDGALLAFAWVWAHEAGGVARAVVWYEAHPRRRDLEGFLLSWIEERAAESTSRFAGATQRHARYDIEEHRHRRRAALEAAGYRPARVFVEMRRPLPAALPSTAALPPGITVVPWSKERDEATRLAANEAFALHWDSMPLDAEHWERRVTGDAIFRPDLSFLATAGPEVVALCLAAVDPEATEREGFEEVWIERVGTRPAWQRNGLATHLLLRTMQAALEVGITSSALTVDQDSNTRATAVYERLGFVPSRRTLTYVKDLGRPLAPPAA
ncbi:MAG: GNAT family N-acetyltransferase [Acidimicrobiia bacterium]|nr:GNAT family N-acetyltransferase [Acidimicrobiia bacterium]